MKVLMFLRDPLPPARADVAVLFDVSLREEAIETDYVGEERPDSTFVPARPCRGRLSAPRFRGGSRLAQLARTLANDIRVLLEQARHYDVVVVRDRPIEAAFLFVIARLLGCGTAYWMSFPIPLADRVSGWRQVRSGRFLRGLAVCCRGLAGALVQRHLTLRLAQRVFAQSDAMVAAIAFSASIAEKCVAVPMGVDLEAVRRVAEMGRAGRPVLDSRVRWIAYLGSLDRVRKLDVLVDALDLLPSSFADVMLVMVGGANDPADVRWLENHIESRRVGHRVKIIPPQTMEQAWHIISTAQCAVSLVPPGPLFDVSSPTKLVEYLALGIPSVATRIPDQEKVIRDSGAGFCVDCSAPDLAASMAKILTDAHFARELSHRGRTYVARHRSYSVLAELVASHLQAITPAAPRVSRRASCEPPG